MGCKRPLLGRVQVAWAATDWVVRILGNETPTKTLIACDTGKLKKLGGDLKSFLRFILLFIKRKIIVQHGKSLTSILISTKKN